MKPFNPVGTFVVLDIVRAQKPWRRIYIAVDQHCRVKVSDKRLVARCQSIVRKRHLGQTKQRQRYCRE
jgi:hypothetical protein